MEKKKIRNYQIFSVIFTFVLGTLLHFTYNWSSNNSIVGLFSAINESTWEHLKLLFFPMLMTTIVGYFYIGKDVSNFFCAKTIGIFFSMIFVIVFFYTYTGVLGKNIVLIDVLSFFISVLLGEYISYRLINGMFPCNNKMSLIMLIIIIFCFFIFTFNPPKIGLFKDPISNKYGINLALK